MAFLAPLSELENYLLLVVMLRIPNRATVRDRVRDALHTRVQRAMAIVCSGFSYDMEVVSHSFVTNMTKTDAENEERLFALIDEAEGPGEQLAALFEPEVLSLEVGEGDEEDKGGDSRNDDQGL